MQRSAETHLGGMVQCRGPAGCSEGRGGGGDGGGGMWTCRQSCHMGALPLSVMPSAGWGWVGSQKLPRWEGAEQVQQKWNLPSSHCGGGVSSTGMRNRSFGVGRACLVTAFRCDSFLHEKKNPRWTWSRKERGFPASFCPS